MAPTLSPLHLSTYLFVMSLSFCICIVWVYLRSKKQNLKDALDLCLILMISGLVGGRLFHVIVEYPKYYIENPINIIKLHQGGFVFYGGFIFAFLFGFLFLTFKKQNISDFLDLLAPVIPLGYALGRIGCFLAGCCFGENTNFFKSIGLSGITSHPTQLYSSFLGFLITAMILYLERHGLFYKKRFFVYLILYGISRILLESLRGDFRGHYPISTFISIMLVIFGFYSLRPLFSNTKSNL